MKWKQCGGKQTWFLCSTDGLRETTNNLRQKSHQSAAMFSPILGLNILPNVLFAIVLSIFFPLYIVTKCLKAGTVESDRGLIS
jgi:hypothetical protein